MKKQLFDFHTHSTASDGTLSPSELVRFASEQEVSALALTDHDTVSGLNEARAQAAECGISFVAGIELNIQWQPGEFHLLGLSLRNISPSMKGLITLSRRHRDERNEKIASLMQAAGVPIRLSDIAAMYPNRPLCRPHFADYIVSLGLAKDRQGAFDKYLGKGKPWYAEREEANLDEAVQAIIDCGGIPIIAHPMSLHISWGRMAEVLTDIKEHGVEGVEAWHPAAREADCRRLERMAHERGLLVSAGSDYHGAHNSRTAPSTDEHSRRRLAHSAAGHCITAAYIDAALLERLLQL